MACRLRNGSGGFSTRGSKQVRGVERAASDGVFLHRRTGTSFHYKAGRHADSEGGPMSTLGKSSPAMPYLESIVSMFTMR